MLKDQSLDKMCKFKKKKELTPSDFLQKLHGCIETDLLLRLSLSF